MNSPLVAYIQILVFRDRSMKLVRLMWKKCTTTSQLTTVHKAPSLRSQTVCNLSI